MMAEYQNEQHEVLQRMRRIETRLTRLCVHVGLDPTRDRDRVAVKQTDPLTLDLTGMDVSIGDLLDACRKHAITHTLIEYRGVLIATLSLGEPNAVEAVVEKDGP
jgi:hypothetical protein